MSDTLSLLGKLDSVVGIITARFGISDAEALSVGHTASKCGNLSEEWITACILADGRFGSKWAGTLKGIKAHGKVLVASSDEERSCIANGELPERWYDILEELSKTKSASKDAVIPVSPECSPAPGLLAASTGSGAAVSAPVAPSPVTPTSGAFAVLHDEPASNAPVEPSPSLAPGAGVGSESAPDPTPRISSAVEVEVTAGVAVPVLVMHNAVVDTATIHIDDDKRRTEDAQSMIWHASALEEFQMCGMSFEHRYVKGIVVPPGVTLANGITVHHGNEYLLNAKRDGIAVSDDELSIVLAGKLTELWDRGLRLDEDETADLPGTRDLLTRKVTLGVGQFRRQLLPQLEPVDIELSFRIPETKWGFGLAGKIDMRDVYHCIWDWKTAHQSGRQEEADDSEQLTIYGLAQRATEGTFPIAFAIGKIVVTTKKLDATCEQFRTYRNDDDYKQVIRKIRHIQGLVQRGAFAPCSHKIWKCTEKFCGYWDMCVFGHRQRTPRITNGG
jgi:hypothetical protein